MSLHGVAVTTTGAQRLRERHPQLPLSDITGHAAGLAAGRPLRRLSASADTLGAAVADPENELVRVWRAPDGGNGSGDDGGSAIHAFDAGFFRAHLRRALALRRRLGLADGVSAYRLLNGAGDGQVQRPGEAGRRSIRSDVHVHCSGPQRSSALLGLKAMTLAIRVMSAAFAA